MIVATVCGGASGVWGELKRSRELIESVVEPGDEWIRLAVSGAGVEHPDPLHHWLTIHRGRIVGQWRPERVGAGRSDPVVWVVLRDEVSRSEASHRPLQVHHKTRLTLEGGTAMPCVGLALDRLRADAVILCGNPLSDGPNVFNGRMPGLENRELIRAWRATKPELGDAVRSMSGRTKAVLGTPTEEWLAERRTRRP